MKKSSTDKFSQASNSNIAILKRELRGEIINSELSKKDIEYLIEYAKGLIANRHNT